MKVTDILGYCEWYFKAISTFDFYYFEGKTKQNLRSIQSIWTAGLMQCLQIPIIR